MTLQNISNQTLRGSTAFRIFKILQKVEELTKPIYQALEGLKTTDPEWLEIEQIEQSVDLEKMSEFELSSLDLTLKQIIYLQPIMANEGLEVDDVAEVTEKGE